MPFPNIIDSNAMRSKQNVTFHTEVLTSNSGGSKSGSECPEMAERSWLPTTSTGQKQEAGVSREGTTAEPWAADTCRTMKKARMY